jgi:integrase
MNEITLKIVVSLYLDKSRSNKEGKYLLRLQVYDKVNKKRRYFATKFKFTAKEYENIINSKKTTTIKTELYAVLTHAQTIVNEINPFDFDKFEHKLYGKAGMSEKIFYQYNEYVNELIKNNQIGNASNYNLSKKSIQIFLKHEKKNPETFRFTDVTPHFLQEYENYMLSQGKSITTVSIYLRALRAIFNRAIENNEIPKEIYPFGKRKYTVPATVKVKKSFTRQELKQLFEATPQTPEQKKAKDFWFFSYACNGMNIKDIVLLKYEAIKDGVITFYREKTKNTKREHLKPITVVLNDYILSIIKKYGKKKHNANDLVFSILTGNETPTEVHAKVNNFTRYVNQHIKTLAQSVGLPSEISTYWARHSFATVAIREGATIEFISEALGHSDTKTTNNYFAGFTSDAKKKFADDLMKF